MSFAATCSSPSSHAGPGQKAIAWLLSTVVLLLIVSTPLLNHLQWTHFKLILGDAEPLFRFATTFFIGACFFLFRKHIRSASPSRSSALLILVLTAILHPQLFALAINTAGAYLLFYIAQYPFTHTDRLRNLPDISYGTYLYGWPVEALLVFFFHPSPWLVFAISVVLCAILGTLSWRLVERPMLTLKPKAHRAPARCLIALGPYPNSASRSILIHHLHPELRRLVELRPASSPATT